MKKNPPAKRFFKETLYFIFLTFVFTILMLDMRLESLTIEKALVHGQKCDYEVKNRITMLKKK